MSLCFAKAVFLRLQGRTVRGVFKSVHCGRYSKKSTKEKRPKQKKGDTFKKKKYLSIRVDMVLYHYSNNT